MHGHAAPLRQIDPRPDGAIRNLPRKNSSLLETIVADRLIWLPEIGVGYYPVSAGLKPYDRAYFDHFAEHAGSKIGRALMRGRVDFVEKFYHGPLVDIGIGCGAFLQARTARGGSTFGWDVNPVALEWLEARGLLVDPMLVSFPAVALWDVLEHIPDFCSLLANVKQWVFVSLPIFTDAAHVLRSKHYKKDEHCWYFTRNGLCAVMAGQGFELVAESDMETAAGREDIGAFAFRRY